MASFDYANAQKMVRDYVCSGCWKPLVIHPAPPPDRGYVVKCVSCGDETPGFVTKYYVEKRRSQDHADTLDAVQTLREAGIIPDPHKNKTREELLKELGFE